MDSVCCVIGRQIVLMPGMSGHPITQQTSDQAQEFREQFERFRCREHFQSAETTPMTEICSNLIFSSSSSLYDGAQGQQRPDICSCSESVEKSNRVPTPPGKSWIFSLKFSGPVTYQEMISTVREF